MTVAYRILHIADVHLDMAFVGIEPRSGARRRRQLEESFERALRLARERGVDAIAIAGDLYEDGRSGPDRAAYLRRVLGDLDPIRVFLAPGNHDPHTASSIYRQMAPLPANVVVFGHRKFERAPLTDGLTLWGFGHERPIDRDPAINGFRCEGAGTHLLLFHGSDREAMPPGKEAVAPFSSADVDRAGAAHAMVGHFHGMLEGSRHAYPGSLEPHTFGQDGRHTAAIVTIEDGRVRTEYVDHNQVRYADADFDISPFADRAALEGALRARLGAMIDEPGRVFCRLRLVGEAQPTLDVDAELLEAELGERYDGLALVEDFVGFDLDAAMREGRTVRAHFVRRMRDQIATADDAARPFLERTLRYGLLAFAGRTIPL